MISSYFFTTIVHFKKFKHTSHAVVLALILILSPIESTGSFKSQYSTCRSLNVIYTHHYFYSLVLPLDLGFCFTKLKNFMTIFQYNWVPL